MLVLLGREFVQGFDWDCLNIGQNKGWWDWLTLLSTKEFLHVGNLYKRLVVYIIQREHYLQFRSLINTKRLQIDLFHPLKGFETILNQPEKNTLLSTCTGYK